MMSATLLMDIPFANHSFGVEEVFVLRMFCLPQASVKSDVVIGDFEVFTSRDDVCFPSNPVDDEPVADFLDVLVDGLVSKAFKVLPDMRVGFMPFPPCFFLLLECFHVLYCGWGYSLRLWVASRRRADSIRFSPVKLTSFRRANPFDLESLHFQQTCQKKWRSPSHPVMQHEA